MKLLPILHLLLIASSVPGVSQPLDKATQLQALIQSAHIPGIQLIYSKRDQVQTFNLGVIAPGAATPVQATTIFEAASLSKAVFAYTVLRLVDRGVLNLDTPLLTYTGGRYERFDPANPAYGQLTARMVLRHTSGLRNWADPGPIPLLFPPDSCFNYSGQAYVFLQDCLQQITHKPLQRLAQDETFGPLGMSSSSFTWRPAYSSISSFGNDSTAVRDHQQAVAASSLLTTAQDYHIFSQALLAGTGLKASTHQQMLAWKTPGNWFDRPVIAATAHIGWGLGVGIQHNEKGTAYWQWGDNGVYKAFHLVLPQTQEHLVYFTHSFRGLYIAQDVVDLFLGKQTSWALAWVKNGYSNPMDIGYANPAEVKRLREQLIKSGFSQPKVIWAAEKKRNRAFHISEQDLRALAFIIGQVRSKNDALEILKLNARLYPQNVDALEGLALGYYGLGAYKLAQQYAQACLAIDQSSQVATSLLVKLRKK